jgi:para-nitrobenzyl esterase
VSSNAPTGPRSDARWTRRDALRAAASTGLAATAPIGSAMAAQADPRSPSDVAEVSTPLDAIVSTTAGRVRGFKRRDVYIYKGIPYGDDTSGANRFMPPRPSPAWNDVKLALVWGPICPQAGTERQTPEYQRFAMDALHTYQGEDCLRLNVWSTRLGPQVRRPVMVWLHGGGFTSGSGHETPAYDGENLARRGVIVVTVNHRLGPLGFMNLAHLGGDAASTSPNAGLLDLVAALQWVRDNIATFGGDPGRVTIFGQSGGGGKVSALMAMPAAKGLFHRAIVMSGSFPPASRKSEELAAATLQELGIQKDDLRALQAVEPARLIAAGDAAARRFAQPGGDMFSVPRFGPNVNASELPEAWETAAPRLSANVPMIIGNVRDEFRRIPLSFDDATVVNAVPPNRRDKAANIVAALRAAYPRLPPTEIGAIIGGLGMRSGAIDQARKQEALKAAPVYLYWYTWATPLLDGQIGVPHGADIPGAFDNAERADTLTGNTPEVRAIANLMSAAFVNFAATGDPGQPGLDWPRFDSATVPTMIFDTKVRVENDPAGVARRLLAG